MRSRTALRLGTFVVIVAALYVVYLTVTTQWIDLINQAAIAAVGATALNLLLGHTGLVSIGNAAFLGIGGLVTAEVTIYWHWSLVPGVLAAGAACAVCGFFVALPSLRIRGLYLAMGTLAFQYIVVYILQAVQERQVGDSGYIFASSSFFGFELSTPQTWYWPLLATLGLWLIFYRMLLVTKPGRAWRAIREQTALASMSGVPVVRYQIASFVISSAAIGVSGGFLAAYLGNMSYDMYTLALAINYLAMVIIGGMGSIYGPIIGAALVTFLPTIVQSIGSAAHVSGSTSGIFLAEGAIVGLVLVLAIAVEPRGLAAVAARPGLRLRQAMDSRPRVEKSTL